MPDPRTDARELDAWIAENVMGWKRVENAITGRDCWRTDRGEQIITYNGSVIAPGQWMPSSDWSAAALVVQRMREKSFAFGYWDVPAVSSAPGNHAAFKWSVHAPEQRDPDAFHGYGESFPEAVCRAARAALESGGKANA